MTVSVNNYDNRSTVIARGETGRETVTATAAATYLEGTVLAREALSGNLVPYAAGGANGTGIPVAVLHEDLVFAAAGSEPSVVVYTGEGRSDKVMVYDGGTPRVLTLAEVDLLRDIGFVVRTTTELYKLDNQ